ncbi:NYN domain-containing protein [Occultella gossypii]|uniref:NYN domain-containing protein n=1 Tax=Occultella gossypii TaxID=2800820 RepID=A0ABS7SFP3_9MICO|nr:NYN domain-containing protein [Occultella gossypii]MBZ2199174.1 NYN domain-containing protein [Occultella gossypii]
MLETPTPAPRQTYLLVDGENIDATLGLSVLNHRPTPDERPRWDRITDFAKQAWGQPVTALFFLNATSGQMPMSFIQALLAMGYHPIPLAGSGSEKVVDIGIQRTLAALEDRPGDVLLASHDGDFVPQVERLLDGDRRVGVLCFREFVSAKLSELTDRGLSLFDLEDDLGAFNAPLPRVRIIPLEAFDPLRYL